MASSERFGYEWQKYDFLLPAYEQQFLKWVYPLGQSDFKGKSVLDAGCGMGRNSFWCAKYGVEKIVAFDADARSVAAAKKILAPFPNARVAIGDIYSFKAGVQFDIVFSIGVIHHLKNSHAALVHLASLVKPGGSIIIWVYGYEGNEWIVRWVNPIRKLFTSRLPLSFVHALSFAISLFLFLWLRLVPQLKPYLRQLKTFSFSHLCSIVFDQLIPAIANYWTRAEALSLLTNIPALTDIQIFPVNNMSWTVIGTKR